MFFVFDGPVDLAVLVGLPEEFEQRHIVATPRAVRVMVDAIWDILLPWHRHDKAHHGPTSEALREALVSQLQPHLWFQRVVLAKDASGHLVGTGVVAKPLLREGIGELGHIACSVTQEHAPTISGLDVQMAFEGTHQILHISADAFFPIRIVMVEVQRLAPIIPI